MARRRLTASNELRRLLRQYRRAQGGSQRSLASLQSTARQLVNRANRQLDALERHGYTEGAYASATSYTQIMNGTDRFAIAPNMSPRDLYRLSREINHFLTLRTSTVSGTQALNRERIRTFRSQILDQTGIKMTNQQILSFFKFLKERPVSRLLDSVGHYESEEIVSSLARHLIDNESRDEILALLDVYWETQKDPQRDDVQIHYDDLLHYLKHDPHFRVRVSINPLNGNYVVYKRHRRK